MTIVCRCGRALTEPLSEGSPQIWPCLSCGRVGLVLPDGDTIMWLITEDEIGSNLRHATRDSMLSNRMGSDFG